MMSIIRKISFLIMGFFLSLNTNLVSADVYNVYGLDFPVDELVEVDSSSVELSINGNRLLVSRSDLPQYLSQYILSNKQLAEKYSTNDLNEFTLKALNANNIKVAADGLKVLMSRKDAVEKRTHDILSKLFELDKAAEIYKDLVLYAVEIDYSNIPSLLYPLLFNYQKWLIEFFAKLHNRVEIEDNFKKYALDQFIEKLVNDLKETTEQNDSNLIFIKIQDVFQNDVKYINSYINIQKLSHDLMSVSSEDDVSKVTYILDQLENNALEIQESFSEATSNIIINLSDRWLKRGKNLDALKILTKLSFQKRTPVIHAHILQCLQGLDLSSVGLLTQEPLIGNLIKYAEKDPLISKEVFRLLHTSIKAEISEKDFYSAETIYHYLKTFTGNYDDLNKIRFLFADHYTDIGDSIHAMDKLKEISGKLSIIEKMILEYKKLAFFGYKKLVFLFLSIISVLVFCIYSVLHLYKSVNQKINVQPTQVTEEIQDKEEEEEMKGTNSAFVNPNVRRASPLLQEYFSCLNAIGARPGASEREIKAAFRNAAKKVHPDAVGEAKNPKDFLELQNKYNRLLELEKQYSFSKQNFIDK